MHCCCGYRSLRRLYKRDWRNETVASSRNGGDESPPALTVAKGAAQSADLHLQIRFFHERLLPNSGHEFLFADNLAGAFDQSCQDVKRAVAEPRWRIALEQEPSLYKELKRSKGDRSSIHGAAYRVPRFYSILLDPGGRVVQRHVVCLGEIKLCVWARSIRPRRRPGAKAVEVFEVE